MKKALSLLLFIIVACKTYYSDYNTAITDVEIYAFMDFAIEDLKISDTVHINKKPFSLFLKEPDRGYFKITDFIRKDFETDQLYGKKVLLPSDTIYIKQQNFRLLDGFEWNKKRLGFKKNIDNPMKIDLSIPYFTKDKQTVLLYKRYNNKSAFMAGGSNIFRYVKTENGWERSTLFSALN